MLTQKTTYLTDFVAWADEQALLLEQERFSELDLINLIEEVRDLGRSERNAIESQLTRLLMHLLKWQYQPELRSNSWEISIKDARKQIRRLLKKYPVLAKHIQNENVFFECYENAREDAADETGLKIEIFPGNCPYSFDEIMAKDLQD